MSEMMNKHQEMARTGHYEGFAKGGRVGHKEHGFSETPKMEKGTSHPSGHGGKSIHNVTSQTGQSTSPWDTDSVGSGGKKSTGSGGSTGGTRNRI
jgi:hypothetical protein